MKARIVKNPFEEWERVEYPTFPKGTEVIIHKESEHFNWLEVEIQGKEAYVAEDFITDGRLNRDYNPTELDGKIGDVIEIKEINTLWVLAEDMQGNIGWVLGENVVSN